VIRLRKRAESNTSTGSRRAGGVTQTDDHIWLVTLMDYDLGYFDDETWPSSPDR